MPVVDVRDMTTDDEYFVSTCSHINESEEIDQCGRRRLAWLKSKHDEGLRAKVGLMDGQPVGFLYVMPSELNPWGPIGQDVMAIACTWVIAPGRGYGVGRALVRAAEDEARAQGKKAIIAGGHEGDLYWMNGFVQCPIDGAWSVLWKKFTDEPIDLPKFLQPKYEYEAIPGKVAVDLFFNTFCETSDLEAQRVRDVAAEFGDAVVLREFSADDRETLMRYQRSRGIFINGKEIGWGYEAPEEGIRDAIQHALQSY